MGRYVQDMPYKTEAGGVLLGRHLRATRDIIVDHVTEPMHGDHRTRTRFYRARHLHQEVIDQAWLQSGGTCTYLGEWHTHAEWMPIPSAIDQLTWRRKLIMDRFTGCIFFVIAGVDAVRVWEGHRRSPKLFTLRLVS
jgi:integrative and conjugative element protein (TIGR02256 family)